MGMRLSINYKNGNWETARIDSDERWIKEWIPIVKELGLENLRHTEGTGIGLTLEQAPELLHEFQALKDYLADKQSDLFNQNRVNILDNLMNLLRHAINAGEVEEISVS